MITRSFETTLDPTKNQLLIFSCPACLPFFFARHLWFVVNIKGVLTRYEVTHQKNLKNPSSNSDFYNKGYLYKNLYTPFQGISVFPWQSTMYWAATLEGMIVLDSTISTNDIDSLFLTYSNKNIYHLLGPNSNTYVAHILINVFKNSVALPRMAIGKDYKNN